MEQGQGGPGGKTLTLPQLAAAGAFAGVTNGFVSGPVEHIRIRKLCPESDLISFDTPFRKDCRHNQIRTACIRGHWMRSKKYFGAMASRDCTKDRYQRLRVKL